MKYKFKADTGDRSVINFISGNIAGLSIGKLKTLLKQREIKLNGTRINDNVAVFKGDEVEIFVPNAMIESNPIKIVYQDKNILIVDKPVLCEVETNLIHFLETKYDYVKPLHRLDRNTTGALALALNESAYNELTNAFREHRVVKTYKAVTVGLPREGRYEAYLCKNSQDSSVRISVTAAKGYVPITTEIIKVVPNGKYATVSIRLVTGKTHQIRAHLAFLGTPVLGDGKYGDINANRAAKAKYQELRSQSLSFFGLRGEFEYLNDHEFDV